MTAEIRSCQNCKAKFVIDAQDFDFYKKIDVPPPTFCFPCRLQRKMARRNERALYKRPCDKCRLDGVSMYHMGSPFSVFCASCWWGDGWDPLIYAKGYDFSKPFFRQFFDLSRVVPRLALYQKNAVNSPYTNHCDHPKNSYYAFDVGFGEEIAYSKWVVKSKDLFDCYGVLSSELCYELQNSERCYRSAYVLYSNDCTDSMFLYNCSGCSHCFLSSNLRNKSYCFANEQLTKEEYEKRVVALNLGSFNALELLRERFTKEILPKTLRKYAIFNKAVRSTGDNLYECKDVKEGFHVSESENSAFCVDSANLKDSYDVYEAAFSCELQYDCHACNRVSRSKFSSISYDNHDLEYAEMCHNSSHLFGCIALRNKQYCVLNTQYSKEEYDDLVPKIRTHMMAMPFVDVRGRECRYGEFFPSELSPFAYNETVAQEYSPLSKDAVGASGYRWKDSDRKEFATATPSVDLPDHIDGIHDDVMDTPITCAHGGRCGDQCTGAFRIIPQELDFYRHMRLPIPRLCPNCRHYNRLQQRNPLKLWKRTCQCGGAASDNGSYSNVSTHSHAPNHCPNEFETPYAPERAEIVYCEECYQQEVV